VWRQRRDYDINQAWLDAAMTACILLAWLKLLALDGDLVRYHLGVDGRIYLDGEPIEHPGNATIDAVEQYLAEIVVKNHLNPELFKDDDAQS
jgi:hypothetical protein